MARSTEACKECVMNNDGCLMQDMNCAEDCQDYKELVIKQRKANV